MKLFCLLAVLAVAQATCPHGSSYFDKTGKCYLVSKLKAQWSPADSLCQYLGGHLAAVNSKEENDFIYKAAAKLLPPGNVFLGAYFNEEGMVANIDGSSVHYTNFQSIDGEGKRVALMNSNPTDLKNFLNFGKWIVTADDPSVVNYFVCELPPCENDVPTASGLKPPLPLIQKPQKYGLYYGLLTNSWFYGNSLSYNGIPFAKAACESLGGSLPIADGIGKNLEILLAAKNAQMDSAIPIGYGSDLNGNFGWDDGSESSFTNWLKLPNVTFPLVKENQRALLQLDTSFWISTLQQDVTSLVAKGFLCQFPVKKSATCS